MPVQQITAATASRIDNAQQAECAETSQLALIERAVERATEMSIVREERFPASRAGCHTAYLLSSCHYDNDAFDPQTTPEATKQSQVQLFQLVHLLQAEGVNCPLFVEGRRHGMGYTPFPIARPVIEFDGSDHDVHTPEAQQFLFDHPRALRDCMDVQQRMAEQRACSTPCFYAYTTYPGTRGAHSAATEQLINAFVATWLPFMRQYQQKYKEFWERFQGQEGEIHYNIGTGWDPAKDDAPLVCLVGEQWWYRDDVLREMQWYLQYADKLAELDEVRERELCELFAATKPVYVPMGFAGKGHEFRIVERLRDSMNLRVLTPTASVHLDNMRKTLPINHPDAKILNIRRITRRAPSPDTAPPMQTSRNAEE
ncbi:MAG: hypothetical protein UY85_C0079G0004 [Candidatus Peribacteria bacterium GW2011_GWB1_54_5]|nr:MAG: hypothetical protein UY85_C0079G0004 [Candidatus Peribacteria bacterium GW2011_GWB1_54_5]